MGFNPKSLNGRQYQFYKACTYTQYSATAAATGGAVSSVPAYLDQVFINGNSTALTLNFYDKSTAGTAVYLIATVSSPATGSSYNLGIATGTGLSVVSTGTGSYTVVWKSSESA